MLSVGRWAAAYYLAGYAVECGLKACILARIERDDVVGTLFFDDRKFSEKCFTHEIEALVKLADLEAARDRDILASPQLEQNWQKVKSWNEKSRYRLTPGSEARRLFEAVTEPNDGVLPWIKTYW